MRMETRALVTALLLGAGLWQGWAAGPSSNVAVAAQDSEMPAGKRAMTFADLQRMKRLGDPQISPGGRWVMFSSVDVDLKANTKTSHLWVVPLNTASPAAGRERQLTFWKEGESGGRFSPDGRQILFVSSDGRLRRRSILRTGVRQRGRSGRRTS